MTAAAGLSAERYLLGTAGVVGVIAVLAWGASRLRARLVPDWEGPPARLVEVLLALLGLLAAAELLGALNWLRGGPLTAACILVGLGMAGFGTRSEGNVRSPVAVVAPRWEVAAAVAAVAVVMAQWTSHAASALHHGMLHADTVLYHGPFSARFLQNGTFGSLAGFGGAPRRFYPQNSELLHAVAAVPFHRDLLSPLLNLGWAAVVLLAAWCIGRRVGVGALCLLGAALVLSVPGFAATQPGQASNDVVCAALLLVAAALLLEGGFVPIPASLAGAAAGLAVGTKLTVAVPVAVLTLGVLAVCLRRHQPLVGVSWCVALVSAGGYWFLRNLVVEGSPAPFLHLSLGPISLHGSTPETNPAAVHYLTDGAVWRNEYLPGLARGFGPVWPLVLGVAIGAAILALSRLRPVIERLVALSVIAGIVWFPFTPQTGGLEGRAFVFSLRYLMPTLLLAFALFSLLLVRARAVWRVSAGFAMLTLVCVDPTVRETERTSAWPADGLLAGIIVGLGLVALAILFSRHHRRPRRAYLAIATIAVLVVGVVSGWFLQRRYFAGRYVRAALPQSAVLTPFHEIRDSKIAVFGFDEVYPLFGPDLSNHVTKATGFAHGETLQRCQRYKRVLSVRFRYVVIGHGVFFEFIPPQSWFLDDPGAVAVVRGDGYAAFRLKGKLHPELCRAEIGV